MDEFDVMLGSEGGAKVVMAKRHKKHTSKAM